jgi:hypothetical protein
MKTVLIIFSAIGLLTLNSCNQKTDRKAILENSKSRIEVFDAIVSNPEFMTEFMVNMHSNPDAMHMMQGNKMMMGNMMGDNGMQMMMMTKDSMMTKNSMHGTMINSEMMQSMMGEMIKDRTTMAAMMQVMQERGMISDECMQASMKMMESKEKGMLDGTSKK